MDYYNSFKLLIVQVLIVWMVAAASFMDVDIGKTICPPVSL